MIKIKKFFNNIWIILLIVVGSIISIFLINNKNEISNDDNDLNEIKDKEKEKDNKINDIKNKDKKIDEINDKIGEEIKKTKKKLDEIDKKEEASELIDDFKDSW